MTEIQETEGHCKQLKFGWTPEAVWFQNRRTKWRKKHAAEMATAKRRQEEVEGVVNDADEGCSDGEASEAGSASGHEPEKAKIFTYIFDMGLNDPYATPTDSTTDSQ
ncbi:hypothetical protein QAD02_017868 [Eretmocerus hayati]|uniref:Uncharacterized protein n=1 Tax=Eretmocerus hayati TaxID=131215 RepID=A0ACC2PGX9_9HYME|nr:hypothetical protein QAD02_017868 [Eretmocerus hayati]